MDNPIRPVIFNVITIVALLFALYQLVIVAPGSTTLATNETIQLLGELAQEDDAVDATLSVRFAADREQRQTLTNSTIATMAIAILANIFANYLGRVRQSTNVARIRQLEAELQGLQSRRS